MITRALDVLVAVAAVAIVAIAPYFNATAPDVKSCI